MSKRTEIVVNKLVSLFEHRFVSGVASALPEHRLFGKPLEHGVFGVVAEHRALDAASEHGTVSSESGSDAMVVDQATLKLSNPHLVSNVTLQKRSDGSFYLIIEE
jgi:hypothetical protein